jgi:hypothetical protein
MSLKILGKKAFVLFLLFLAMAGVYVVKNDVARESYFNSFKSIVWRADIFRGLIGAHNDDIKIDLADINMDGLIKESKAVESPVIKTDKPSAVVAKSENSALDSIAKKVQSIALEVNRLQQEVREQITLNQIEQQIDQISEQINRLSNEIKHGQETSD